jgi:uncharacterized protein YkwD
MLNSSCDRIFKPMKKAFGLFGLSLLLFQVLPAAADARQQIRSIDSSHSQIAMLVDTESLAQSIHNQVNRYRQSQNLPPLVFDETIAEQARAHSINMANINNLSHDGFDNRLQIIKQVIPYGGGAENVAYNMGHARPDDTAIQGWIESPGHNRNMLGNYDLTGIGVAKRGGNYYFTQIFIRKISLVPMSGTVNSSDSISK